MNDEIMRLFLYLLTSNDIKKQGDRIIGETKSNSIAENIADILFSRLQQIEGDAFVKFQELMFKQGQTLNGISTSVLNILNKIDTINKSGEVLNLANRVDELEKLIPIQRRKNS